MRNRMGSSLNLDTTVVGLQGFPISPTGPTSGQALVFNGTDWTPTNVQTTAPPPAAVGPTPPASPGEGDLWFNTTTGILNVWNGSAWVPTYVDSDPFLPLAGGTLTGPLTLAANAAAALQAVPLQQLDSAIAAIPPPPPPTSVGSTPPASPGTGDQWFNTDNGTLNVWNGTAWVPVEAVTAIGSTPPTNPAPGQLWWDDVSGQLFVWYVDANSSQWVVANVSVGVPGPPGPAGPPGPNVMPPGVTDGSNAAPGQVGEIITFNWTGSVNAIPNGSATGVNAYSMAQFMGGGTGLAIPPGVWQVQIDVSFTASVSLTAWTQCFAVAQMQGYGGVFRYIPGTVTNSISNAFSGFAITGSILAPIINTATAIASAWSQFNVYVGGAYSGAISGTITYTGRRIR